MRDHKPRQRGSLFSEITDNALHFVVELSQKGHKEAKYQMTWNQRSLSDRHWHSTKSVPEFTWMKHKQNFQYLDDQQRRQCHVQSLSSIPIILEWYIKYFYMYSLHNSVPQPDLLSLQCETTGASLTFHPLLLGRYQVLSIFPMTSPCQFLPLHPWELLASVFLCLPERSPWPQVPSTPYPTPDILYSPARWILPKFVCIMSLPCSKTFSDSSFHIRSKLSGFQSSPWLSLTPPTHWSSPLCVTYTLPQGRLLALPPHK